MNRLRARGPAVFVAAVALSACASTPSQTELAQSILDATAQDPALTLTPDEAMCIANELLAGSLSDTTLDGLADDFGNPVVLETEKGRVESLVAEAAVVCR